MTRSVQKFTDLLNGRVATAITRTIVFLSPFVCAIALYAGKAWLNERINESPSISSLSADGVKLQAAIVAQDLRITQLERVTVVSNSSFTDLKTTVNETKDDVKKVSAQMNRLLGAFEARGLIPPQSPP